MTLDLKVGKHTIQVSNLDRVLFPRDDITKGDLLKYYAAVAPFMLPYLHNRMLSMQRFPNDIDHEGFFQKDAPEYFPKWIKRAVVKKQEDGLVHYVVCNNPETLIYLANHATITMHLGLSKIDKMMIPDQIIFDLDPSKPKDFASVKWAAFELKKVLETVGLIPFVKTTGGKGVHVVVPIKRSQNFDEVRAFAYECAQLLVEQYPTKLTTEIRKEKRGGKIFVDTLRNAFGQTAVAPYTVRARDGAPIAMPISWEQLQSDVKNAQQFTVRSLLKQIKKYEDPWHDFSSSARTLKLSKINR